MIRLISLAVIIGYVSAAIQVEHSFDGSTFSAAGKLIGNYVSDTELRWERPALGVEELELLEKAVDSDGLYSVRVKTDKATLLSSVPAACLRKPGLAEQVELHATRDGALVALNYDVLGCSAKTASAAAGSSDDSSSGSGGGGSSAAAAQRPERLPVRVLLPKSGPMLTQPEAVGEFMDIPVESVDLGSAAYDPNAKPRAPAATAQAAARKGGPPPPDERTWLQKNWMFVLAAGMMVLNVIAKANAPPQGPGGAPGGGAPAGAGGPRRG